MWLARGVFVALMIGILAACASPEEKAYKAQERSYKADAKWKEERLKILDDYRACVEKSGGEEDALRACDHLLKAIEAMK